MRPALRPTLLLSLPLLAASGYGCSDEPLAVDPGCYLEVTYSRADGQPFADTPVWIVAWIANGGTPSATTRYGLEFGRFRGERPHLFSVEGSLDFETVIWTKAAGFAATVTDQPSCFHPGVEQVLSPIAADEDAVAVCPTPPISVGCTVVTGVVVDPSGSDITANTQVFSIADPWSLDTALELTWGTLFEGVPRGTVLFVVTPHPGETAYYPLLRCLDCGDYRIELEPWP